jgi:hypothetical protein
MQAFFGFLCSTFSVKKALSFRLAILSKRLIAYSFLLIALFIFTSCRFNPKVQGKGEFYLQGEWQQDSIPAQKKLLNYSLYRFKFTCDSFYVQISSFSKVNYGADTCMNAGHWKEYAKGFYEQKSDTLHLKGFFSNADFSLKNEGGCFRSGVYDEAFKTTKKTDSIIQFINTTGVIPFNARLIKRTTCNPKPL